MALGTGNKLDPTLLRLADISETYGCPLARVMRKELRSRGIHHLKVVFSPEEPAPTRQMEAPPPGRRSVPASTPWVPAAAGLLLGTGLTRFVVTTAEIDSIMFGRNIYPFSFLMAALLTFLFSFLVNWAMHYRLKKISMVESMKSVD